MSEFHSDIAGGCNKKSLRASIRNLFNLKSCGFGAGGGFMASHAVCLALPFLGATVGTLGGVAFTSAISIGTGLTGLYVLNKLRGVTLSRPQKVNFIGGLAVGAVFSLGLHFNNVHHQHNFEEAEMWVNQFPPQLVEGMREEAVRRGVSWPEYLIDEYKAFCKNEADKNPSQRRGLSPR